MRCGTRERRRIEYRRWAAGTALAIVALGACGQREGGGDRAGDAEARDDSSSPFVVDDVPRGFRLAAVGMGAVRRDWVEDSTGTDEPFTLLAPAGEAAMGPGTVIASATGFRGYQGGLSQAARGRPEAEELTVDGAAAVFTPAATDPSGQQWWADLVVEHDDDLAVRVTAPDATQEDLAEIAERVAPSNDRARAPIIEDPGDLRVIGSVDADVVASPFPPADQIVHLAPEAGARTVHRAGWTSAAVVDRDPGAGPPVISAAPNDPPQTEVVPTEIVVTTYPGDSARLDALAGLGVFPPWSEWTFSTAAERVNGRPAVLVESLQPDYDYVQRTLFTETAWGDLLSVSMNAISWAALDTGTLVRVAESVRPARPGEWAAQS